MTLALALAIGFSAAATWYAKDSKARLQREATYQAALIAYSKDFKPGMTREEVETRLSAKAIAFQQMCCVVVERSAYASLVKIGQEAAPWYCSYENVYIAFVFKGERAHHPWNPYPNDQLARIIIYPKLEECL